MERDAVSLLVYKCYYISIAKSYKVSQKKWELLLVIVAVIHTFLGDTLYIMVEKRDGAKIC